MVVERRFPQKLPIHPRGPVNGSLRLPGSRSLTNRALLCATLAEGTSRLVGALAAEDTQVMMHSLSEWGGVIEVAGGDLIVHGTDGHLRAPGRTLYAGASGTTARFLTAAATLVDGPSIIDGTARMRRRPIKELVAALVSLGAEVEALGEGGCPPVRVAGGKLSGGSTVIDARRSSQFVSAVALAAPYADADTELEFRDGVLVSRPYVRSTVEVMGAFGVAAELTQGGIRIPRGSYQSATYEVEPDASGAVYPLVAAALTGGTVHLSGLSRQSTQADVGIVEVLATMGCRVEWNESTITLTGPSEGLQGVEVDMGQMPDAAVAVAVAAAFASGPSRLTNIANLRIKETDRLAALETELRKLGAIATTGPDWLAVEPSSLHGTEIDTYDDHRIAMAFSLAGLVIPDVVIRNPACVAKTWPSFFDDMEQLWPPTGRVTGRRVKGQSEMVGTVVAIDGPGGAGKTTVSRGVAARLGLPHLDTGASYRAAALVALNRGIDLADPQAVTEVVRETEFGYRDGMMLVAGEDVNDAIRSPELTSRASRVSAIPEVREVLVAWQRVWVEQQGGSAVIEGRDIGTVVFPDALVKIFLTARPAVRAARRAGELLNLPEELEGVARELERRDRRDSTRQASPLRPAEDAVEVDTSDMPVAEVIAEIVQLVTDRVSGI